MDVFDLFATISLDSSEYEKGLDEAERKGSGFGDKLKGAVSGAGKVIGAVGKASAAAIGAAATGIGIIGKNAIEAYADYEQLVGGVETLFGNTYSSVEEYAEGIGASMEYASATWEQYQERQQSVLDNANNAYMTAGLSANEYMETVTGFAAALNSSLGENAWQSANYADEAITDMADNANKMGTSMESIQNAYNGFAKGNFTMLDNLKLGYGGTKEEMERLMRDAEEMEGYIEGSLSLDSFADVIEAIHIVQDNLGITGTTAREAASTISGSLAMTKSAWTNLVAGMANDDADMGQLIDNLISSAELALGNLLPVAERALVGIGDAVVRIAPIISEKLPELITSIAPGLLTAGAQLVEGLINGLIAALPSIMSVAPTLIGSIVSVITDNIGDIIAAGAYIIATLALTLIQQIPQIIASIPQIISSIRKAFESYDWRGIGNTIMQMLGRGISAALSFITSSANSIKNGIINAFNSAVSSVQNIGRNIVNGLWNGIAGAWNGLVSRFNGLVDGLVGGVKSMLGIHSPSKVFEEIGAYCTEGFENGIEDLSVGNAIDGINNSVKDIKVSGSLTGAAAQAASGSISNHIVVTLEGDAKELFRVIRQESKTFTTSTGIPAFS